MKIARAVLFILLLLAMVSVRVLVGGYRENGRAERALAAGDVTEAVTAYDRSMHWYLPGSPTIKKAAAGLIDIARKAEFQGDHQTALRAWRVLRSGFFAAQWIVIPRRDVIDECDRQIARLVADQSETAKPGSHDSAYEQEMAVLTRPQGPSPAWSMLAIAGFLGWIGATIGFIFRAFGPTDEFHRRPALLWGVLFLAAYTVWMVALSRA